MKYCVTGADGYLGQGVVKKLLDIGYKVVAAGFNLGNVDCRAEKVEGNIFKLSDPYEQLGCPDVLLHLAWRDGFVHNSNVHLDDLPLHCRFVEQLAESSLQRLCVMGTMHEIGRHEGIVNEKTPCFPRSKYGIAKNALRDFTFVVAGEKSISCQWIRGFYIVDGNPRGCSVFSKIVQRSMEGADSFPLTSGVNQFDFLDYQEFCNRTVAVITQSEHLGIINVCSGKPESLASRVRRFIADEGLDIVPAFGSYPDRPYDSPAIWGDSEIIDLILEEQESK